MNKTKAPLIISKSKIDSDFIVDVLLPIGLLGFVLYLFLFKEFEITSNYSIALLGLIAFTFYRLVKRFRNRRQIIIDSIGIKLLEENKIFIWEEIQFAYIKDNTLHIITKRNKTAKSMEGLNFSPEDIEKAITNYSGRDIANYSKISNSEVKSIIGDDKPLAEIIGDVKKFNNYQALIGIIIVFGIIGISIYLQVKSILNYTIGYGFILVLVILLVWDNISFKKLKFHLSRFNLADEQVKDLGLKQGIIASKKEIKIALIVWSFITVAAFVITYIGLNHE